MDFSTKGSPMKYSLCFTILLVLVGLAFATPPLAVADATTQPAIITGVNPKDGAEMVFVPAGPFKMGINLIPMDQEQRPQVNSPKHEVALDAYWIYKYPVTVKEYKKFIADTNGKMPEQPDWGWKDDHPMVNVSWMDADKYAKWVGAALPTEAQWEKAARGTDERIYPWGNEWNPQRCVHSDKIWGDHKSTEPVGSRLGNVSPYGVMDMAGNIWEWCNDWYKEDYYNISPANNPPGAPESWITPAHKNQKGDEIKESKSWSVYRIVRGGAWCLCDPKCFQTVNRDWGMAPSVFEMDLGFRCAVAGK